MARQMNSTWVQLCGAAGGAAVMALGTSRLGWPADRVGSGLAILGTGLAMQSQGWLQQLGLGLAAAGLGQALQRYILQIAGYVAPEEPRQAAPADAISREELQQSLAALAQQYEARELAIRQELTLQAQQYIQQIQQQAQVAVAQPEPAPEPVSEPEPEQPPAPPPPRRRPRPARPSSRDVFDRQQGHGAARTVGIGAIRRPLVRDVARGRGALGAVPALAHPRGNGEVREHILRPQDAPAHANGVAHANGDPPANDVDPANDDAA